MPVTAFSLAIERKAESRNAAGVWLQVAANLDPRFGGIAACVPRLAEAAEEHSRHLAPVAAFCEPDEDISDIEGGKLQVFRFPAGRAAWMGSTELKDRLRSLIEASDGVHIHGIWGEHSSVAASLAREAGKPYIMAAHGMLEVWALQQKRLKKILYSMLIERRNLQDAACLHALTRAEVDDDGADVVGQCAVRLSSLAERLPDHHVGEQGKRGVCAAWVAKQGTRQPRIVQHRIDAFVGNASLQLRQLFPGVAGDDACRELRVVARQMMTCVGENHFSPPVT